VVAIEEADPETGADVEAEPVEEPDVPLAPVSVAPEVLLPPPIPTQETKINFAK
jgi:hypothetical protein